MFLFYRGTSYTFTPLNNLTEVVPCVVNWRYQLSGQIYGQCRVASRSTDTRVVNWRYQLPAVF